MSLSFEYTWYIFVYINHQRARPSKAPNANINYFLVLQSEICFLAYLVGCAILGALLDNLWPQVSSLLPPPPVRDFGFYRAESFALPLLVYLHRVLPTLARALSATAQENGYTRRDPNPNATNRRQGCQSRQQMSTSADDIRTRR